jgi:phosphoglycolate phosphatase-like HAD superfamily hydrolase
MSLQALIFDVDGTLANTEHDGHLRAFNEAFEVFGLDWYWDSDLYGALLSVSGGKERLNHYISEYSPNLDRALGVQDIAEIHNKKTEIFISGIANGQITLRIGVERHIKEALESNLRLAIATLPHLKMLKH